MTVDIAKLIDNLPAERREATQRTGEQFASQDTLRQADETMQGLGRYGDELVQFGYASEDADLLQALRDALADAVAERQGARVDKHVSAQAVVQAVAAGKTARLRVQALLARAESLVGNSVAQKIAAALGQTRSARSDAQRLLEQLVTLRPLLDDKDIAIALKKRGGPEAAAALADAITDLTSAEKARPGRTGTPAETAQMNLLDGLIAENVRDARRAARAAAKTLGRPEIADAFELGSLYGGRGGRKPATPPTPPATA